MEINKTGIYLELKRRKSASSNHYLSQIDFVSQKSKDILERIPTIFYNYTKHDISHSINVAEIMYELISDITKLSDLELCIMILSAVTHDLGMFVGDEEIKQIKKDQIIIGNRKFSKVFGSLGDEVISLEECIRPQHAIRSAKMIKETIINQNKNVMDVYGTQHSYFDILSKINRSHNESTDWIRSNLSNQIIGKESLNPQFISLVLRLADLLDVDDRRTSFTLKEYLNLPFISKREWDKHSVITNHKKTKFNEKTKRKQVVFYGETDDSELYRNLLQYFHYFEDQLSTSIRFCRDSFNHEKYQLNFENSIENKIIPKGFSIADFKLNLDYGAVTELLMGENIYGNKKYGIRELLQNALDACDVLSNLNEYDETLYNKPVIRITWDEEGNRLVVRDTGIGMTEEVLKKYFLNVGVSYYRSNDFLYLDSNINPIGNYGIGFLACFMLSDTVKIRTRHYNNSQSIDLKLQKQSEYIEFTTSSITTIHGTSIELNLTQVKSVFENPDLMIKFIEENFLKPKYDIFIDIVDKENSKNLNPNFSDLEEYRTNSDWVNLSNYFDNIEVLVKFKRNQLPLYLNLEDLDKKALYLYKDEDSNLKLGKVTSECKISDYFVNNTICFLEIPMITGYNMDEALSYVDDFDSALNHVENEVITVYYREEDVHVEQVINNHSESVFSGKREVYGEITLTDIYDVYGDLSQYDGLIEIKLESIRLIERNGYYLRYLGYADTFYKIQKFNFDSNMYRSNIKFYVKGVLVSNVKITLLPMLYGIEIERIIINSENKKIIPNISRNSLIPKQIEELNYSINRTIVSYVAEKTDNKLTRNCIDEFISANYSEMK
ncbi:MAG: ATP-binding protein [Erysipelotrichaceae bacterium]|nr:ATP-binding protein [Erysipelotrichaceae bacterium]